MKTSPDENKLSKKGLIRQINHSTSQTDFDSNLILARLNHLKNEELKCTKKILQTKLLADKIRNHKEENDQKLESLKKIEKDN